MYCTFLAVTRFKFAEVVIGEIFNGMFPCGWVVVNVMRCRSFEVPQNMLEELVFLGGG